METKTRLVYISGPMSGYENKNRYSFMRAENELHKLGYETLNPARLDQANPNFTYHDFMKRDISELLKCDAICLIPGWENSKGALCEKVVADSIGLQTIIL